MRHSVVTIVLGAICLLNVSHVAEASVGGKCARAGTLGRIGSVNVKCVRVGKSLTWVKTVSRKKQDASASVIGEGSSCVNEGDQVTSSSRKLECRRVAAGLKKYVYITGSAPEVPPQTSPSSLETCRLRDFRTSNISGQAITYPPLSISPMVRNLGVVTVAVIFVEYPDALSKDGELASHLEDVKHAGRWVSWYSQGKVSYQMRFADRWVRAPRPSGDYRSDQHKRNYGDGGSQVMSDSELASSYRDLANSVVDMNGINVLWVVNPRSATKIDEGIMYRNPAGPLIFSIGHETYESRSSYGLENGSPIWQHLIHETLHSHGLLGHSPKHEFFGLMNWGSTPGATINSWDAMVLDWMRPENLYCVTRSQLTKTTLTLVPLEREQGGLRSVIVKLSESEALVVESHRRDQWSQRWPAGTYGVTVMKVDTRIDTVFDEGSSTSRYLMSDKRNSLMVQGETFTTDGVQIRFVSTGDNDVIEIAPVS